VCVCVCVCVCVPSSGCRQVQVLEWNGDVRVCTGVCTGVRTCAYVCVGVYTCVSPDRVYMCVCMCVCMCVSLDGFKCKSLCGVMM